MKPWRDKSVVTSAALSRLVLKTLALTCACAAGCAAPSSSDQWELRTKRPIILAGDSDAYTPVIKADTVFFCGGYFWNGWDELFALTAATGQVRWHVPVGRCKSSPVLIASAVVALAEQNHGVDHVVHAVDVATGRTLWTQDLGDVAFHAARGDVLYVSGFKRPPRRINAAGQVETIDLEGASDENSRIWIGESSAGVLVGSGDSLWRIPDSTAKPVRGPKLQSRVDRVEAVAAGGDLLILQDRENRLTAFDLNDGRVLWTRREARLLSAAALLVNPLKGATAIGDRRVFVNTFGPNRYELQALDASSGSALWSARDGSFDAPTADDRWVYAAGRTSVLIVDERTGRIAARIPADREIVTSPVRAGELIYFGTIDGVLHAAKIPPLSASR